MRLLRLNEAYGLCKWTKNEDIRLQQYNFSYMNREDVAYWFKLKQKRFFRKIFGVFNDEDQLIGFVTVKHINFLFKSAFLGVAFNPEFTNQGYGTLAILEVINHVFFEMQFNTLYLDVASFNQRAIRSYEKNHFCIVRTRVEKYESQEDIEAIANMDKSFFIKGQKLYTTIERMRLRKVDWLQQTC